MSHHNLIKSGYSKLADRLNKFPQGAPPSDTLSSRAILVDIEINGELNYTLPPVKQIMASKQIKSRYLETLLQKKNY